MIRLISILLFVLINTTAFAGWVNLNTGINDNLLGVVMNGNNGIVTGHSGIYYTTNGGAGPSSWNELGQFASVSDSLIYVHSIFSHCNAATNRDVVMICGQDTINNKAVIFKVTMPEMTFQVIYQGEIGSKLNYIGVTYTYNNFYAVGDNGLLMSFTENTIPTIKPLSISYDIKSISIYSPYLFSLAVDGRRVQGNLQNSVPITYDIPDTTSNYSDVYWVSSSAYLTVGNVFKKVNSVGYVSATGAFGFGPLNATKMHSYGSYYFVGTDHGIFRSDQSNYVLERQPSSIGYSINEFCTDDLQSKLYAVGSNGTLLYTTDNGGIPFPYVHISSTNGCVGSQIVITSITGSELLSSLYIDGNYIMYNYASMSYVFTTPGIHHARLIGYRSGMRDTSDIDIVIENVPHINYLTSIDDSILCKSETITIHLDSSQQNKQYQLFNSSFTTSYSSPIIGTGDSITITSDLISLPGNYYLQAQSTLVNCKANFTEPISIEVDHTKAAFHSTIFNAEVNEPVLIMENCTDAQNFSWSFTPSATPSSSSQDTLHVSFENEGSTEVELICWSNNGCYDTLVGNGPTIYHPLEAVDSCWINTKVGVDLKWSGYYYEDIGNIIDVKDGYLVVGQYSNDTLKSQLGENMVIPNHGGYLSKYNFDGVLKWVVHFPHTQPTYLHHSEIRDVDTDSHGNIYIVGEVYGDTLFDNTGERHYIQRKDVLIKFDSLGRYIWHNVFSNDVTVVAVDNNDDVFVSEIQFAYTNYIVSASNVNTIIQHSNTDYNCAIIKINSAGEYVQHFGIYLTSNDQVDISDLAVDNENNLIILGDFRGEIKFYSTEGDIVSYVSPNEFGLGIFVAKYDSASNFVWRTLTWGRSTVYGGSPSELLIDSINGNIYVTGSLTNIIDNPIPIQIQSNSGATDTINGMGFLVLALDKNGEYRWRGSARTGSAGMGLGMCLEGPNLYVMGNQAAVNNQIMGANGTCIDYSSVITDFFVAQFDTLGNIHELYKSNNSVTYGMFDYFTNTNLFKRNNCFYASKNGSTYTTPSSSYVHEFGDSVTTYGYDAGWVIKFVPSCGIANTYKYKFFETFQVCYNDSFHFPSGIFVEHVTSNMIDSLSYTAIDGRDSIYYTSVQVFNNYSSQVNRNVCFGEDFTFPDGTTFHNIETDTSYISSLQSIHGCDSTEYFHLNVVHVISNAVISGATIQATGPGSTYYWINCENGYSSLQTPCYCQTYTPNANGYYAVVTIQNYCSDTSECIYFNSLSIENINELNTITLYPNPTNRFLTLKSNSLKGANISFEDLAGRTLITQTANEDSIQFDLLGFPSGIYVIRSNSSLGSFVKRVHLMN